MTMQICEGCGLPARICDALTHYRAGARLLSAGNTGAARDELGQAEAMIKQWQRWRERISISETSLH